MKIAIIDSINNIPSHKQFQDLALDLTSKGHHVVHYSDTKRENYGISKVVFINSFSFLKYLILFFKEFIGNKPDVVISTFRANRVMDLMSWLFSFRFYPSYKADFFSKGLKYRFYYRKAKTVFAESSCIKKRMEEEYYPHLKGKLIALGNSFNFNIEEVNQSKKNIILSVAGFNYRNGKYVKGVDLLLEAYTKHFHQDYKLIIVGGGEGLEEEREKYTANKNITFTGNLQYDEVLSLMKESKVFVLPSRHEAFGNVYLEAMSKGCSLIGSKETGAEDIIIDGKYGYLVEQENINDLAQALNNACMTYTSPDECIDYYSSKTAFFSRKEWIRRVETIILDDNA